jgi:hypothetical protein
MLPLPHFAELAISRSPRPTASRRALPLHNATKAVTVDCAVDYSALSPLSFGRDLSLAALHAGVLRYIFFHSGNRYNTGELLIQYTALQPNSDPICLFGGQPDAQFELGNGPAQCIVITFKRARICPTALVVDVQRGTQQSRPPTSYVFEGWDTRSDRWTVLTERQTCCGGRPTAYCRLDFIDTEMEFTMFRLTPTGTALPSWAHWSITALEIHGRVRSTNNWVPQTVANVPKGDKFEAWTIDDTESREWVDDNSNDKQWNASALSIHECLVGERFASNFCA